MSKPFYNHVADQLSGYFASEAKQGIVNRYFLSLPSEGYVKDVLDAVATLPAATTFSYKLPGTSESYTADALRYGKQTYVLATTLDGTHIDFLVTLRNLMSEQKGEWKNTSLVIISDNLLDSIQGGSKDLTSEGMPLHVSQIVNNLEEHVKNSALIGKDKEILLHYLAETEGTHYLNQSSFLDFEEVLTWTNGSEMQDDDYKALGYFKDFVLTDLIDSRDMEVENSGKYKKIQKEIEKRLTQNVELFDEVSRLRELGNGEDRLIDLFDDFGKKLYKDDDGIDLADILKAKDKVADRKDIFLKADEIVVHHKKTNTKIKTFWQKSPKKRTYELIIFHPEYEPSEEIEVKLPFSRYTSDSYILKRSAQFVSSKGQSLYANIALEEGNITFKNISYRHENMTSSAFTFRIMVLKEEQEWLSHYELTYGLTAAGRLSLNLSDENVILGDGSNQVVIENEAEIVIAEGDGVEISFNLGLLDDDTCSIQFDILHNGCKLPVIVSDEVLKTKDITSQKIWLRKINLKETFILSDEAKKINIGQQPYKIADEERMFYLIEQQWLENNMRAATYHLQTLTAMPMDLPEKIEQTYNAFLQAIGKRKSIPSLTYYDEELRNAAKAYIEAYLEEIQSIKDNDYLTSAQKNLLYLGTLRHDSTIYMSPFSPLNVAYQLEIIAEVDGQIVDENILKRLNPSFLLPYLVSPIDDNYLKPDSLNALSEWHCFQQQTEVQIGETNAYLANVIREKLKQFIMYYDYLFTISSKPKLYINIINLTNDQEILKGILKWFKDWITQTGSLSTMFELEVTSYEPNLHLMSAFELFNTLNSPAEVKDIFDVECATKQFDAEDVLLEIQKHLSFSKVSILEEPRYSHLTFYKMQNKEQMSKQIMQNAPNAMNLNGLFVSPVSQSTENGGYRIGFGVGSSDINRALLTRFTALINELSANMKNAGRDPYKKDNVISLHIDEDDEHYLKKLYSNTTWLTFIDPAVDLRYFQESSDNLVIVHYSDQLSSSSKYDAITVTDKSKQYFNVIDGFLQTQGVSVPEENIDHIIKSFNTFNGEWLLRAVQNQGHDKREKISIVAAIKHALLYFNQTNILWVPISMEEIVRVAGSIRLSRKDGIFSGKTIGKTGNCSDDLLLIGLEQVESNLKLHFYPVEVKIGINSNDVIEKGIKQVKELNTRIKDNLIHDQTFDAKFLRNFFARMFIINANKIRENDFWPEQSYVIAEDVLEKLLNDDFTISDEMVAEHGVGAIISFKKNLINPTRNRDNMVLIHEIPENVAYRSLGVRMEDLKNNDFSLVTEVEFKEETIQLIPLPAFIDVDEDQSEQVVEQKSHADDGSQQLEVVEEPITEEINGTVLEPQAIQSDSMEAAESKELYQMDSAPVNEVKFDEKSIVLSSDSVSLSQSLKRNEPLFGYDREKPVYWEYGSTLLSNRHLVIGGRSGQGKTYFIQSVLKQLVENGQSALIVDFSSSYTRSQLNPKFLNLLGDRLEERIVYYEGFPINPFRRREKIIAGKKFEEKVTDTASRIRNVFASVYKQFGDQQQSAIYRSAKKCIEMYGDKASLELMLEVLQELPDTSASVVASIVSKLNVFVDIDPFDYENEFTWDDYFTADGKVFVIQFEGFDQDDIKKLMTEFILWDLFSFAQSGNVDKPLPIVLDEAQNLDFGSNSPSEKILREGRKFGLSAWFATQTFSNFTQAERTVLENAATSIFFKPAESELSLVARKMNITNQDELRYLQKGECIIQGQFMEDGNLSEPKSLKVKVPEIK
ncbi:MULTISPECIES: DNA phosphorothioation-dependent restriction protein DptH [unclassified Viridibacillus]|uniref:DNA phosphorothioation-dependent restriction protein DptH n=1 Tax=unclassified Viridibacillus TaxID=2617942 RepID=UPI00096F94D4|nr:DNA phosphorothioation-dependent restriction protein DptH [Viridibacillus sp. FSL H8-0123]OMC78422.1 DNA phosphorothioation-dependent restriction protein DptH [Viridibacillus sp. FSL H8-0123]